MILKTAQEFPYTNTLVAALIGAIIGQLSILLVNWIKRKIELRNKKNLIKADIRNQAIILKRMETKLNELKTLFNNRNTDIYKGDVFHDITKDIYESIPKVAEALQLLHEDVSGRTVDGNVGDYEGISTEITKPLPLKENFFQSFSEGSAAGDKDDLGGSLGKYSLRCYYRAALNKNPNSNKWMLNIYDVGCRFFDTFSFNDNLIDIGPIEYSQPLGCWEKYNITDPEEPSRFSMSPYKVCIQNVDYIELKDSLKGSIPDSCADFFIYSEMKVFDDDFLEKDILII